MTLFLDGVSAEVDHVLGLPVFEGAFGDSYSLEGLGMLWSLYSLWFLGMDFWVNAGLVRIGVLAGIGVVGVEC